MHTPTCYETSQAPALPNFVAHQPPHHTEADGQRYRLPYATGAHGATAVWNIAPGVASPHMLVAGRGKTSLARTVITGAAIAECPVLVIDAHGVGMVGIDSFPGVAAAAHTLRESVALINAVHAEMVARARYVRATATREVDLPVFVLVIDEFFVLRSLLRTAASYAGTDPELRDLAAFITDSAPLSKIADICILVRRVGGRILLTVPRPTSSGGFAELSSEIYDSFDTRAAVGHLDHRDTEAMWGRAAGDTVDDPDSSTPGRANVTGRDGAPMPAQVHWTPRVDDHPTAWAYLGTSDRQLVTDLRRAAATSAAAAPTAAVWWSTEMRQHLTRTSLSATAWRYLATTGSGAAATDITAVHHAAFTAGDALAGLPRRLAHTRGVAAAAAGMAHLITNPRHRDAVLVAAWVHDIGYSDALAFTGCHPIDGAIELRERGFDELVVSLVAHHTGARHEAEQRDLSGALAEFTVPPEELLDVVTAADLSATPDGEPTTAAARIAEILDRYQPGHPVHTAITASGPELHAAYDRVHARLDAAAERDQHTTPPATTAHASAPHVENT